MRKLHKWTEKMIYFNFFLYFVCTRAVRAAFFFSSCPHTDPQKLKIEAALRLQRERIADSICQLQ